MHTAKPQHFSGGVPGEQIISADYRLLMLEDDMEADEFESGELYVSIESPNLKYTVLDVNGKKITDYIPLSTIECSLTTLDKARDLAPYLSKILIETSKRGHTFSGELDLATVRIILTDSLHVEQLKEMLTELGISDIEVHSYESIPKDEVVNKKNINEPVSVLKAFKAFKKKYIDQCTTPQEKIIDPSASTSSGIKQRNNGP